MRTSAQVVGEFCEHRERTEQRIAEILADRTLDEHERADRIGEALAARKARNLELHAEYRLAMEAEGSRMSIRPMSERHYPRLTSTRLRSSRRTSMTEQARRTSIDGSRDPISCSIHRTFRPGANDEPMVSVSQPGSRHFLRETPR